MRGDVARGLGVAKTMRSHRPNNYFPLQAMKARKFTNHAVAHIWINDIFI